MKLLVSFLIALGAIVLLFWWGGIEFGDVWGAVRGINPWIFGLVLVIQATIHLFRGLRLRGLIHSMGEAPPPIRGLASSSAAWILDSQVLPGRIGEATLVLHLKRVGVDPEHGVVGLLLSRLLDLFTLSSVLCLSSLILGLMGGRANAPYLLPLGAAMLGVSLFLAISIFQGGTFVGWGRGLLRRLGFARLIVGAKALSFGGKVEDALHSVPRAALYRAAGWSLCVTAAIIAAYIVLGTGVGLPELTPLEFFFGASFAILGSLLPISGFLGIGAFDMAWAFGFAAMGVPQETAVATGFAFHALYLVSIAFHGAWGHALLSSTVASMRAKPEIESKTAP